MVFEPHVLFLPRDAWWGGGDTWSISLLTPFSWRYVSTGSLPLLLNLAEPVMVDLLALAGNTRSQGYVSASWNHNTICLSVTRLHDISSYAISSALNDWSPSFNCSLNSSLKFKLVASGIILRSLNESSRKLNNLNHHSVIFNSVNIKRVFFSFIQILFQLKTSRERPKSAPYLRLKKTRKPLFLL